jgi:hypothetical protein
MSFGYQVLGFGANASGGGASISATGGTITEAGGFKIHTFTSSGTFSVSSVDDGATLEYVIIAGGGAGGGDNNNSTGGGGAGGYIPARLPNNSQSIMSPP